MRTLMWLSIFVLQHNFAKLHKRPLRQRRTIYDLHAGPFHLPITPATSASHRMWLGHERTEMTDTELQEKGFTVGKPRQYWSNEQKQALFDALVKAALEPRLPDQDPYRYIKNHHLQGAGIIKTETQIKNAVKMINRKAPGWEQVPQRVHEAAAQAVQLANGDAEQKHRELEEKEKEAQKSDVDLLESLDNGDDEAADGDDAVEDDEDGEGDDDEQGDEDEEDKALAVPASPPPSPPSSPIRSPAPASPVTKFGADYAPKMRVFARGSFMDQVRLLERGGFCRSPKGRRESYYSLRDVEHHVPAPSAVTGGKDVLRQ